MTPMLFNILRWGTLIVWVTVGLRLLWPSIRLFMTKRQHYDFFYFAVFGTAINRLWRWYHDVGFGEPADTASKSQLLIGWYEFAIIVGLLFHAARWWYGDCPAKHRGVTWW